MIIVLKLITFIIGTILVYSSIKNYFANKNGNILIYPIVVFYVFYYIPLLLDLLVGRPFYKSHFRGFIISGNHIITEIIFCIVVLYILYMMYRFHKKNPYQISFDFYFKFADIIFIFSVFGLFLMMIYLFSISDAFSIFQYNMRYDVSPVGIKLKNYSLIIITWILILILLEKNKGKLFIKFGMLLPYALTAFMMNGKKSIVFIFVIGLILIFVIKRTFQHNVSYILVAVIALVSLFLYDQFYQEKFGGGSTDTIEEYSAFRVTYGRDDTMKMVLYSELNKDKGINILEYRGQTMLYYISTALTIRRDEWDNKPYPYATYFTSGLIGEQQVRVLPWTMTTSIFDELISNFGVIGILLSPYIFKFLSNIIVRNNEGIVGKIILFLGILLSVLMIAVQISAFIYLYILLAVLIILYKLKRKIRISS
ncbi:oligosaccharide repeat unit polymerase [Rossellomorea vietnamensis]|uniref:Oligosaccharide repeat unit polymerase n=1 Tax=Rossellomorea vietnamensis TaxID=218284 RepID=A0A5D4M4C5_9BACI|nr:O-antigen polymerase [Rossellomorea vietnamensis]TYR95910.1 oligosaccharide repeat unit polymerase [Rossellomorea vietnamensis]